MSNRDNPFWKKLKPEQRLHASIVDFCNWYPPLKGIRWHHVPSEYPKNAYQKFLWSAMGCKPDISDLIFLAKSKNKKYSMLVLELKAEGTLIYKKNGECYFPAQEEFLKDIRKQGGMGEFSNNKDEAIKIIKDYFE